MNHILCVRLMNWPIDRYCRSRRLPLRDTARERARDTALVLVHTEASRQIIIAASKGCHHLGITPGMTLTQAKSLKHDVMHDEYVPHEDARALRAIARWMMRFSSVVQAVTSFRSLVKDEPPLPGTGLFMEVGGSERLYRSLPRIVRLVQQAFRRWRIEACMVIAPTPAAAWALTSLPSNDGRIVSITELDEAVASLHSSSLRLSFATVTTLDHLGIRTIAQLRGLPREVLPARFGAAILKRLDQLIGRLSEPLTPAIEYQPIVAKMEFEGAIESLEAIHAVLQELLGQVIALLQKQGRGARSIQLDLKDQADNLTSKILPLAQPSRDAKRLFALLCLSLESLNLSKRNWKKPTLLQGFTAITLRVLASEPIENQQVYLLKQDEHDAQRELSALVDVLQIRLGREGIGRPRLDPSHLPERQCRFVPVGVGASKSAEMQSHLLDLPPLPTLLYPMPEPIDVVSRAVESGESVPLTLSLHGQVQRLAHCSSLWRISGPWWEGRDRTRDYFDVEDESGRRLWIFRVAETNRWFCHGLYV